MPKLFSILLAGATFLSVAIFPEAALAQAPVKQWDKTFGGNSYDRPRFVQVTRDGGSILGGESLSGISGDKTQANTSDYDYWVLKLDAAGNKVWDRTYGGFGREYLYAAQQTTDGGYLLGGSSTSGISGQKTQDSNGSDDFWIVRINANGDKLWDKSYGNTLDETLTAILPTSDGGFLLGGYSDSNSGGDKTEPCRGSFDFWIVRIDASGTKLWDRTLGGSSLDFAYAMSPTADGGVIVAGSSDSGVNGDKSQPSRGVSDYWLVKLDANGQKQWDRTLGGSAQEICYSIQPTSDGGYILNGLTSSNRSSDKSQDTRGGYDYWVVKLDASGAKLWDRSIGGIGQDRGYAVLAMSDGGAIVGGTSTSDITGDKTQANRGDTDFWLARLTGTGSILWDMTLGGSREDDLFSANNIQATSNGDLLVSGSSNSPAGVDKTQNSKGLTDYWLIKLTAGMPTASLPGTASQLLNVYPNPAHSTLSLRLSDQAPRRGLHITLLDATGRRVYAQSLDAVNTEVSVQVGYQPAGLYLLRLEGPNGYLATQRVVLE